MTQLLDKAIAAVSRLDPDVQDEIARAIMMLAGEPTVLPVPLSDAERAAIAKSKAAAQNGGFATDEEVRATWAKHGL